MPVPTEYSHATEHFYEYFVDTRDTSGLVSTHQAYTMTQGVLQAFRRRLEFKDAILFAGVLPVGLRALFVADWDTEEPKNTFEDRVSMTKEVESLRVEHNWAPETAIHDVASALRRHVDESNFNQILDRLPEGDTEFWEL